MRSCTTTTAAASPVCKAEAIVVRRIRCLFACYIPQRGRLAPPAHGSVDQTYPLLTPAEASIDARQQGGALLYLPGCVRCGDLFC